MFLPNSFIDSTKYFGLSISKSSLKAVSITQDSQIKSYAQFPLKEEIINGQVNDPDTFTKGIETLKSQGNFDSSYVSVVLPETAAFAKEFTTPKVSITELDEAISWQIDEIFPFSTEEIYYDWKLMYQDDHQIKALVVSIQKKLIDSIRSSLAKSKLYPISFEPAVSALSRISSISEKEFIILLDVDQKGISASLINKGVSLLTTTNNTTPSQQAVGVIQESILSLLSYYKDKNESQLENYEVVLTGDLAENNLLTSVNNQLNIKAQLLDISNITPPFHKAYAAAASNIFPPESENSINLLPKDLSQWYQDHYHQDLYKKTSKYFIGTLIASGIITSSSIGFMSIQNKNIQPPPPPTVTSVSGEINPQQVIKKANQINQLFSQKIGPQEEMETALALIPKGIRIESINFDASKNKFQIFGVSQDRQELLNFKKDLEESEVFNKVSLPLGAFTSKENTTFSMDFYINSKNNE